MSAYDHSSWLSRVFCLGLLLAVAAKEPPPPPACQLRINSIPEGASVSVDGLARDVTPLIISDLPPGEHLVILNKRGYETLRKTVQLSPEQRMALDLQMKRLTGLVLIRSEPDGAEVRIDNTDRGTTPLLLTDLAVGKHEVLIKSQGYNARTLDLEIKDRKPVRLDVALGSDSATVLVDSEPPGARVIMNGLDSGTTPCTVERVPAGDAFLKVELEGYAPVDQIVKMRAGVKEAVRLVLKPLPAQLGIVTIPPGARVYVNNQFRGLSPVSISNAPPDTCRIRVEKDGYETMARSVILERAQNLVEEFRMEDNVGIMELVTAPAGVRVFLDGEPVGETKPAANGDRRLSAAWTLSTVPVGEHTVQLAKEGYQAKEFQINMQRNETITRHEQLKRLFIPNYEVRTRNGAHRGVLQGIDQGGTIRLEVRPGVVRAFRGPDVLMHQPYKGAKTP